MSTFSPKEILSNPQSEALTEELQYWTVKSEKQPMTIDELLESTFGANWREEVKK